MQPLSHFAKGLAYEQHACLFLEQRGLELIMRNYRCRAGELDLIMRDGDTLVFIEVRYRANHSFGGATASVTLRKQQRLIAAAQRYLQQYPSDDPCRFDVIAINGNGQCTWLRSAFHVHDAN
ncbi:YraN family protein [Rhodopseudomonas palustris]|uniref:UPF0102 protein HUK38_00790 n=1 Tax=Thiospirillum jenense TaxID=1653858 RepID=A0A839H2T0_9GAMM|nr:YraN family protein [Thiospirillum jenense]MBB1089665.1 YraN family protein [Rhodopseudomonas palustris]MBB1124765.1 YraN family protein [Thiospirillum jenense]